MTDTLDAAIRDSVVLYAQTQELGPQDEEADDAEASHRSRRAGRPQADNSASSVKQTKILRVARMLVDSNPQIRNRGMASVGNFFNSFQELTEDELLHVWTTLYYAAWLSDKPLVQRDFFVRASLLHRRLRCPQAKTLFFCSFFRVLVAEWGKLDRHRTNKFLLFCRIFLAEWMHVMRLMKWEETFVRVAVEFLCEEVMLHGNARGVALHIVDVLTDEFRMLLDPIGHPASNSGDQGATSSPEQKQEERLSAFSWLFVPLLRCCCFSTDAALVARIHERSLQTLNSQDVDLNFVAATLFALASDKRVRSENRKRLFSSHEHVKEEAGRTGGEGAAERHIGNITETSFAQLMVDRVISNSAVQRQSVWRPDDPLKEFPNQRKPRGSFDGTWNVGDAQSAPAGKCDTDSAALPKATKREKKRRRLLQKEQQQWQEHDASPSGLLVADETPRGFPVQKPAKNKQRNMQPTTSKGTDAASAAMSLSANGLRLPIRSSGVKGDRCAVSSASSPACSETGSGKEADKSAAGYSPSPADNQKEERRPPSGNESLMGQVLAPSIQEQTVSAASIPLKETQNELPPSRRRSLRISETSPHSKRVLFNLKKNKVVAFSRHAPSSTVGPASPQLAKGVSRSSPVDVPTVSGTDSPEALPRGILRAAKQLGPPTDEEMASFPPITKSQGPAWWDGDTADLMAFLRRALARKTGSISGKANDKQKKRKIKLKKMKRAAKTK